MNDADTTTVAETVTPRREPPTVPARAPDAPPLPLITRLLLRVVGWMVFALGNTWRVKVYGREWLLARRDDEARVIVSLWHGQLLPVAWVQRQPTRAMISEHRDGELIARVVGMIGIGSIRGSSSRGGVRALLECVRTLREGSDVAITPDGPRGPRHSFAPGPLIVAHRAQTVIVPIGMHIDRSWRLRSWDQFEIPKPFARITTVYGPPINATGEDARDVAARTDECALAMQTAAARAETLARRT